MNKLQPIRIPPGIIHLSDWPDILNHFPNQTFVFNKVMTGCGATTLFLRDPVPTVLCSPRKELIHCKANDPDFVGKVHQFGSTGDDVLEKINAVKNYYNSLLPTPFSRPSYSPKILVTYDSTKHVIQALRELGVLDQFRFVVDEFQTLMTDAAFRGDTEAEFMENLRLASCIVFLSATPYLEDYLDMLDEFRGLPYLELSWPESSVHPIDVAIQQYVNGSPTQTVADIVNRYRTCGYFEEMMDNYGNPVRATEAIFFVNDVKFIAGTVKKNKLAPSDVNIICSDRPENHNTLKKAGLTVGHAPKEGTPHPTYTFVTKAAYEGTDFYHTNGYTYIFSDIRRENLAIDISLDVPQILGRQRLDANPFRYSATFFCKTIPDFSDSEKKEYMDEVKDRIAETENLLEDFDSITDAGRRNRMARLYRNNQKVEKYKKDYTSVVDDKYTNEVHVVFNKYVMVNELRAWDVQMHQYQDISYVMASMNDAFSATATSTFREVKSFVSTFSGSFEQKMKMYAEFLDAHPKCKEELQKSVVIPNNIKEYYNRLGSSELRSLSWKEANIIRALNGPCYSEDDLLNAIRSEFTEHWYSDSDIKNKLQEIYDRFNVGRTAKAKDIESYLNWRPRKKSISGTRENGHENPNNKLNN